MVDIRSSGYTTSWLETAPMEPIVGSNELLNKRLLNLFSTEEMFQCSGLRRATIVNRNSSPVDIQRIEHAVAHLGHLERFQVGLNHVHAGDLSVLTIHRE